MSNQDQYIIVNKAKILERIEELEKAQRENPLTEAIWAFAKQELEKIPSQSTPLIPEIEKAWKDGRDGVEVVGSFPFTSTKYVNKNSQQYISNLKLDI